MERIIYGTVVDISDYPYQVALVSRRGHRKRIICGGALVKPRVVFTAAHCTHTRDDEPRDLEILVGANYVNDPDGVFHEIDSVMKHPDFSYHALDNDFSVITLKEPVEFNHKTRNIAVSEDDLKGGTVATISGWGRTEHGTPSKYLRATKLTVEKWSKCQDYFPGAFHPRITRNMICVRPSRTTTYFVSVFLFNYFDFDVKAEGLYKKYSTIQNVLKRLYNRLPHIFEVKIKSFN